MKKFSDVLSETDSVRIESAQQNLAQAVLCLDEGRKEHLKAIEKIEKLREEIVQAGDNLNTLTTLEDVQRLYHEARILGGSA